MGKDEDEADRFALAQSLFEGERCADRAGRTVDMCSVVLFQYTEYIISSYSVPHATLLVLRSGNLGIIVEFSVRLKRN